MAAYSMLDTEQIDQIERYSGLRIDNVQAMDGGMANSSFRASTPTGPVVITVLDNHDEASAVRLAQLMSYLNKHGIPTQKMLDRFSANGILVIDGKPMILKEFIDGHHMDPVPPEVLPAIGGLLAQVHLVPPPDFLRKKGRRLPVHWETDLGTRPPERAMELLHHVDAMQTSFDNLPTGLIHGDLFADNLLVDDDGRLSILDWETATIEPYVLDIGMTAVALCRTANRLDGDRLDSLVGGYQARRTMTTSELDQVHSAIEYANGVLMFHRYLRHNIRYPDPSKADIYQELVDFGFSLAGL